MNQLPTFIEYLLLNHDYVVIPGFGTFITQQMEARRNEEEEIFLPPYRSVRFNRELTHNDNLLYSSIREVFGTSMEQAEQLLGTWVSDIMQTLEDEGEMDFGSIGVFTLEPNATLSFTSVESGVTSPDYYGLDAFHISEVTPVPKAKVVPMTATMETSDKEITIRINRHVANWVVAACAAIILFVVFNNPLPQTVQEQRSSIKELIMNNVKKDTPESTEEVKPKVEHIVVKKVVMLSSGEQGKDVSEIETAVQKETKTKKENPVQPITVNTPRPQPQPTVVSSPHPQPQPTSVSTPRPQPQPAKPQSSAAEHVQQAPHYCVVVASAISERNAANYAARLKAEGYNHPRVHTTEKTTHVVVGNFETEVEAYRVAEAMRQNSVEFKTAWVLKL